MFGLDQHLNFQPSGSYYFHFFPSLVVMVAEGDLRILTSLTKILKPKRTNVQTLLSVYIPDEKVKIQAKNPDIEPS